MNIHDYLTQTLTLLSGKWSKADMLLQAVQSKRLSEEEMESLCKILTEMTAAAVDQGKLESVSEHMQFIKELQAREAKERSQE